MDDVSADKAALNMRTYGDTENQSGAAPAGVTRASSAPRTCQGVGASSVFLEHQGHAVDNRLHPAVNACSDGPEYLATGLDQMGAGLGGSLARFVWIHLSSTGADVGKPRA